MAGPLDGSGQLVGPGALLRLDPRGGGKRFELRRTPDGERWFRRRDDSSLQPCEPLEDRRLPLGPAIAELRRHAEVQTLAYRPAKRLVLRLEDERGPRVLKGYRSSRLSAASQRHRWAAAVLRGGPLSAVSVDGVVESQAALVLGWAPGGPLDLGPGGAAACALIGAGLATLQSAPAWPDAPAHDARDELAVLDGLAQTVAAAGLELPPTWVETRAALVVAPEWLAVSVAPCHRDLHDGQFVAEGARLTLLDFDLLCLGDPLLDVANLIAHVELRRLQGLSGADEHSRDRCGPELLAALDRGDEPCSDERLRFYQAATFLRLALVYALRPPWAHLSAALTALARRCLHGR